MSRKSVWQLLSQAVLNIAVVVNTDIIKVTLLLLKFSRDYGRDVRTVRDGSCSHACTDLEIFTLSQECDLRNNDKTALSELTM
jgi:hypothetical protein